MSEEEKKQEENNDEIEIDLTKLTNLFKRKKSDAVPSSAPVVHESESEASEALKLDFASFGNLLKNNQKILIYTLLVLLLLVTLWVRFIPLDKYQGPFEESLTAMDPYAWYRWARGVQELGFPGSGYKLVDGVQLEWDFMHNAPYGGQSTDPAWPYIISYSYDYVGQFFTDSLLAWTRILPALIGTLAVFSMFLLVRQLFGSWPGLAAAFLYSFSSSTITRHVVGFADTDAIIAFLTIFTLFLFFRAWDRQSFVWGILAGLSFGLFSITWTASFIPMLLIPTLGLYFLYHVIRGVHSKGIGSIFQVAFAHLREQWKKYAIFVLMMVIGALVVFGNTGSFANANFLPGILSAVNIKAPAESTFTLPSYSGGADEEVRNVMLTVSEMMSPSRADILARIHIASLVLIVLFFAQLPFGLWKRIKEKPMHLLFFTIYVGAFVYASTIAIRFIQMLIIPLSIFIGVSAGHALSKINLKKPLISLAIISLLAFTVFFLPSPTFTGSGTQPAYVSLGVQVASQSGPSLGTNWIDLFKWMRTETPEDAIMASWWDPGHAVAAIGERPVVADGAQHPLHVRDLGMAFTATNESEAIERLGRYNVSYFFTSTDLFGKYGAISFLGRGQGENYPTLSLGDVKQTAEGNVLIYPADQNTQIYVTLQGDQVRAVVRQGLNTQPVARVFYTDQNGQSMVVQSTEPDQAIDAMLYVFPGFQQAFFLPPHLENNLLTQLHLFDGQNLEHFEMVQNFGGEIKVFKVN